MMGGDEAVGIISSTNPQQKVCCVGPIPNFDVILTYDVPNTSNRRFAVDREFEYIELAS